jgi:hypothetical protein
MSLVYASASTLVHKIDRLSSLVSYNPAPVGPRVAKTVNINGSVTSTTVAGSPVSEDSLTFPGGGTTGNYLWLSSTQSGGVNQFWNATAANSTDGGGNGGLWIGVEGQFTIECYVYIANSPPAGIFEQGAGGIALGNSGSFWYFAHSGSSYNFTFGPGYAPNQWYNVAVTRIWDGSNFIVSGWIDGIYQTQAVDNFNYTGASYDANGAFAPNIGVGQGTNALDGYIQEYRISNIARYTAGVDFTPTTIPFVNDANTLLLIHGTSPIQDDNA